MDQILHETSHFTDALTRLLHQVGFSKNDKWQPRTSTRMMSTCDDTERRKRVEAARWHSRIDHWHKGKDIRTTFCFQANGTFLDFHKHHLCCNKYMLHLILFAALFVYLSYQGAQRYCDSMTLPGKVKITSDITARQAK
ncbi:hypothetical protein Salat_0995900 [Sesamum alatum]|uniref:Uncharacterized protein n=1 Tax=Sesamum alatum TaxID=300844 RepID=A0AAE1YLX6_9LAMI|nr:hypothetical protein Salat_0995900 [Sesamum alatum]